jgi:hypothetical protein
MRGNVLPFDVFLFRIMISMSERLQQLQELQRVISGNPNNVSKETRLRFWKIVREIKRETQPDEKEVLLAAEVRNILFTSNQGRTYALGPSLALMAFLGILGFLGYVWTLGLHLDWMQILSWSLSDWSNFGLRFLFVFAAIAFFYPFGRLIAGRWSGIKIEGMCRDQYYEPTLKIDYVTFLKASASRRKWFFFFAGAWTAITAFLLGIVGLVLDLDFTAFIPAILIALFEGYVISSGNVKPSGGEMGHYNREKRIESELKRM